MTNGIQIDEKQFEEELDTDAKLLALFRAVSVINVKLDNRKWKDKGIAAGSGLVGGYLAVISVGLKKLFLP